VAGAAVGEGAATDGGATADGCTLAECGSLPTQGCPAQAVSGLTCARWDTRWDGACSWGNGQRYNCPNIPLGCQADSDCADGMKCLTTTGSCSMPWPCNQAYPQSTCQASSSGKGGAASGNGAPPSCDDQIHAGQARMSVAQAAAAADLHCQDDSDCTFADNSTVCTPGCGTLLSATGAAALRTAIEEVNTQECGTFAQSGCRVAVPPCTPPMSAACVDGTCAYFPPAAWSVFYLDQAPAGWGISSPPSCSAGLQCTEWKVTPDSQIIVNRSGTRTSATLSAADFATVDGILRSKSFRQNESMGFQCGSGPSGPTIEFSIERQIGMTSLDASGCVNGGPEGNDAKRLFEVLNQY
jgi:hypothetical protein